MYPDIRLLTPSGYPKYKITICCSPNIYIYIYICHELAEASTWWAWSKWWYVCPSLFIERDTVRYQPVLFHS